MEFDPKTAAVFSTGDPTCFGFATARNRWPAILTGVIDDLQRSIASLKDGEAKTGGLHLIAEVQNLRDDIVHDRLIRPLATDCNDLSIYNNELAQRSSMTWLKSPWLFAECFMFKTLDAIMASSIHWRGYDVFSRQKMDSFRASRDLVLELATRYLTLVGRGPENSSEDSTSQKIGSSRDAFMELSEVCLWGNVADLSLHPDMSSDEMQELQGSCRKNDKLLCNDLAKVWDLVQANLFPGPTRDSKPSRVDIVLDNAGFELYGDLLLAGWLLSSNLADKVVLHAKSIPWFVSDVMPADFQALLGVLQHPRDFFEGGQSAATPLGDQEVQDLQSLHKQWQKFVDEGRLEVQADPFWTHAGSFWRMPSIASGLFEDLKKSSLIIFKGDLNYRKLVGDVAWDPTTPFHTALGPLGEGSGLSILALRTCKADVIVGLDPGVDEKLRTSDACSRTWAWTGDYAVASLSNGNRPPGV